MNRNARNLLIIRDIVGPENFKRIAQQLNGEHVVFNNYSLLGYVCKDEQDAHLLEDFWTGSFSSSELADKYGLGIEAFYKIVEKHVNF